MPLLYQSLTRCGICKRGFERSARLLDVGMVGCSSHRLLGFVIFSVDLGMVFSVRVNVGFGVGVNMGFDVDFGILADVRANMGVDGVST